MQLVGSPREVGRTYGQLTQPTLQARLARVREQAAAKCLSQGQICANISALESLLAETAPHWLEEIDGIAEATGIDRTELLAVNCLPDGFWDAPDDAHHCTSFFAVGSASKTCESVLHKNRDERDWAQSVRVKQIAGVSRYLGGVDIGNVGLAQFVNEHGLCGANNTGSHIEADESIDGKLTDCMMTRLIAEKARSCEDALGIIEDLIDRGLCSGAGTNRGVIFLFADRDRGLIVECTSKHAAHEWIDDGLGIRSNHFLCPEAQDWISQPAKENTLRRYERAGELILPHKGQVTSELFAQVSRDHTAGPDSICNDNHEHFWMTVSGFTHTIRREHTALLTVTWICNGNTRNACYFPMHLGVLDNRPDLVSGAHNEGTWTVYEQHGCGEHLAAAQEEFERMARERAVDTERVVAQSLAHGWTEDARMLLTKADHGLAAEAGRITADGVAE